MGSPVEIEWAVDLDKNANGKPTFYILQIKPLIRDSAEYEIDLSKIKMEDMMLYTERAMGNGRLDTITDVIYVDPEKFDKSSTADMVKEIDKLNKKLKKEKRKYILIGPGRWGTRDRWLGIPVNFSHISQSAVIVEMGLKDYQIDSSLGSHFFHNITSMNIGYFTIPYKSDHAFINWEWLGSQTVEEKSDNFVHIRLEKPMSVVMDGRKSVSIITKEIMKNGAKKSEGESGVL